MFMTVRMNPRMFLAAFVFLSLIPVFSSSPPCAANPFSDGRHYVACADLQVLESWIHWTYHPASKRVDMAFRKASVKGSSWVAWAVNPTATGMIGSQAVVAFQRSDGTVAAYTSPVTTYRTLLRPGNLSFAVDGVSATYENGVMTIFLTLTLPGNDSWVHHVWQEGPVVDGVPGIHALSGPNLQSVGVFDFASGKISTKGSDSRTKLKLAHGFINAVSWGLLMPVGVLIARYVKFFHGGSPAWFYLHVSCQCTAYVIGLAGFFTGISLGAASDGVPHPGHRCIGITLVCLSTTQVLVGKFFRPRKDHKLRVFWTILHFLLGYGTVALGILNVFLGMSLLGGYREWKLGYIWTVGSLGAIAISLQVCTWVARWRTKKAESQEDTMA